MNTLFSPVLLAPLKLSFIYIYIYIYIYLLGKTALDAFSKKEKTKGISEH